MSKQGYAVSGHSDGLADILSIVIVLAVEHWIIASLIVGLIMYLVGASISENAQTNAGAIASGIIGVCGQFIFGFGVLASIIGIVKFIWTHT
ncbi:hypothetical protein U9040_06785 [Escherichia coli]